MHHQTPYKPHPRDYQGTELRRNPGFADERFHAYELPSRMGNKLFCPDGRVLPFPGTEPSKPMQCEH